MTTQAPEITYVDADVTPGANYVSRRGYDDVKGWYDGPAERVQRPPLTGHVHVRTSDRCVHNDHGPLCPDPTR